MTNNISLTNFVFNTTLPQPSDSGGVEEEINESFLGSSDDGQPGGNDDESQLLVNVAAANYTKPYSAKSVKKSKTSKPSSVPSSQPSVSDVPSVSTDPSSQPSMNPSISGIPSSHVSGVWILFYTIMMLYK